MDEKKNIGDITKPLLDSYTENQCQTINISFKDLNIGINSVQILKNVSGYAKAGEMLVIMGPSGAGKTTLMNYLGGKLGNQYNITGELKFNGKVIANSKISSFSGFILQNDILFETLTPKGLPFHKESLEFYAKLSLNVSKEEKMSRVESLIEKLQLENCQNTFVEMIIQIGGKFLKKSISGGEKKRTCIALELIRNPSVILLDGRTVICTIHQPNSDIFGIFTNILLMKGGQTVFQGMARDVVPYMKGLGMDFPAQTNPADFFMDSLKCNSEADQLSLMNYENYFTHLDSKIQAEIKDLPIGDVRFNETYHTNFFYEFWLLSKRAALNILRNPIHFVSKIIVSVWYGLLCGGVFFNSGDEENINSPASFTNFVFNVGGSIYFQAAAIFMAALSSTSLTCLSHNSVPVERVVFSKEHGSGLYRVSSYFFSKVLLEIPSMILFPLIFNCIAYFMCGYNNSAYSVSVFCFLF